MNHPTPEEWMEFVYDESPASGELGRHLKTCPVCQAHVAEWRKGMATLNAWPLAVRPARWRLPAGAARWAAAALIFLAFGYGFGRLSSPAADQKALVVALRQPLKESIEAELREQVMAQVKSEWEESLRATRREVSSTVKQQMERTTEEAWAGANAEWQRMLAAVSANYSARRSEDRGELLRALGVLRKDIETVALFTVEGFQTAESQLVRLASQTAPAAAVHFPENR